MKKYLISLTFVATIILLVAAFGVSAQDSDQPYLGIMFGENESGALVTRVLRDTPAADAGLQAGDIITAVNGDDVTAATLADAVSSLSVGDTITLSVLRDSETLELDATLAAQPDRGRFEFTVPRTDRAWLGVTLNQTDNGIVIDQVAEGSPAADAGLQAGDILTAINGEAVETSSAAAAMIGDLASGDSVTLSITRDGEAQDIDATLGSYMDSRVGIMARGDVVVFDGENWRIMALSDGSALAGAGVQAGDVITAINGETLDAERLGTLLDELAADDPVTLTIDRNGETVELDAPASALSVFNTFGFRMGMPFGEFRGPNGEMMPDGMMPFSFDFMPGSVRLGVQFTNLDADVAAENNLSVTDGALITEVLADSPAADAGLQVGDVVVSVNGDVVDAERTLRDRLYAYEPEDVVTLEVLRDGETLSLDVTLGSGQEMGHMPFNFDFGDMPFDFNYGDDGTLHFFFGPDGQFNFQHPPVNVEPAVTAPNA